MHHARYVKHQSLNKIKSGSRLDNSLYSSLLKLINVINRRDLHLRRGIVLGVDTSTKHIVMTQFVHTSATSLLPSNEFFHHLPQDIRNPIWNPRTFARLNQS
jgi:hypothetical protein